MTKAQIELLQRLIAADRYFHTANYESPTASFDDRGVEVSVFSGVDTRTAESLVRAGLAETVEGVNGHTYIFLGKYNPYDCE